MIRRALLLAGFLAMTPAISQAAVLMMVEGVIGPSKTTGYSGWFNLNAFSWSIDRSKTAEPHDVSVVLDSSATVATLIQASANGASLKKMVFDSLHIVSGDAAMLLDSRVTCEDPLVRASSVSQDENDRAVVELRIRCGRLAWELYDYNSSKGVATLAKGSWNFRTNTP